MTRLPLAVDEAIPFRGRCALCGHADVRHRELDAIRERHAAGETLAELADDYGLPVDVVDAIVTWDMSGT